MMNRSLQLRLCAAALLAGTGLSLGGCASARSGQIAGPVAAASPVVARKSSDYVYVMVEGSNVPVLMLKSQAVTSYPGVNQSEVSYLSPGAFHELINHLSVGT